MFKNLYKIMNKTRCFLSLVAAVLLASCAARTGMPEFSVFNMSVRNEAVQVPSEVLIDDVSIVKLDNSAGAPVIGIIEDVHESENAYYIVSSETVYEYAKDGSFVRRIGAKGRGPGEYLSPQGIGMSGGRLYVFDYNTQKILIYGEDGSFISSSDQSALMNSGIYLSSFFFRGGDMILYASSNSSVQDMLCWDAVTDELTAVSERSREMLPEEVVMGENYIFGDAPGQIPLRVRRPDLRRTDVLDLQPPDFQLDFSCRRERPHILFSQYRGEEFPLPRPLQHPHRRIFPECGNHRHP